MIEQLFNCKYIFQLFMAKGVSVVIAARIPLTIVNFMDDDVNNNNFMSRSDWLVSACREYVKIRQKELAEQSQDSHGGGVS